MFCTKCGNVTQEDDLFCQNCGAPVRKPNPQPTASQPPVYQPPVSEPPAGNTPGYPNRPVSRVEYLRSKKPVSPLSGKPAKRPRAEFEERVRNALCDLGKSPVLIIAAVLFSLTVLINLFNTDNSFLASLEPIFKAMDVPRSVYRDLISTDKDTVIMVNLGVQLPNIMMVVAFWLLIGSSFAGNPKGAGNGGLVLLTIVEIINIVSLGLVFLFGMGSLMSACSELGEYSRYSSAASDAQDALGMAMVVLTGVLSFALVIRAKTLSTVKNIRDTVNTSYPDSDVSVFVGVMSIIGGAGSVTLLLFGGFSFVTLISGVAQILLGTCLFTYKNVMVQLENESGNYESGYKSRGSMYGEDSLYHNNRSYNSGNTVPAWKRVQMAEEQTVQAPQTSQVTQPPQAPQVTQTVQWVSSNSNRCSFCGEEMSENQTFCGVCGRRKE